MTEEKFHIIWSNENLDYEKDWKDFIEEEYPEITTDEERQEFMAELNDSYLDSDRDNLDITLPNRIIAIGDVGRWDGRRSGYKIIESGNISDCLSFDSDCEIGTWYVDEYGEFRCNEYHHDGANFVKYRVFKSSVSEDDIETLEYKIWNGTASLDDIDAVTDSIGKVIANVYGWALKEPIWSTSNIA